MQNHPRLRYHQAICDLLGVEPRISPAAQAAVAERERACGTRFPASLVEWFSLESAHELFEAHTNTDELIAFEYLGDRAELAQGLLHVATENQGVLYWFAHLDGSDDPPIYHDNNTLVFPEDDAPFDFSDVDWQPDSTTFTIFIFAMLSNLRFHYDGYHLRAEDKIPTPAVLEQLRRDFQEGPRTETEQKRVYRFFTRHADLIIRSDSADDIAASKAVWTLAADTVDQLYEQTGRIWNYGTLTQTLTPGRGADSERQVIERVRADVAQS